MTDETQLKRFGEAVERKNEEAEARSKQPGPGTPSEGEIHEEVQQSTIDDGTPQDVPDPHHQSSRHRHVTAENWNQ
jgi:hypothetical protein